MTPSTASELPEFSQPWQDLAGWHALHLASGRQITAPTFEALERRAVVVRIVHTWATAEVWR
ncbi:hypothetical protein [Microbispora sp. GKU 823]|uniref:hypothetical protein n=1 Tax=Microbispora sp. GKU 823 TaxID=1652100 RepID=UPI0009A41A7A|nr:hypothetical protein [Microbispora sp. GKU 823]OPG04133.1 hypothetical protein B1L11_38540 [Microbispora sp. GKU 823]